MPDAGFPFILLTGRATSAQWHTETRTAKSAILEKLHSSELLLEIHPEDARKLNIRHGGPVEVVSRRATIPAVARVVATVRPGQVFLPLHDRRVNELTASVFDPHSRQPAYKFSAVRVTRAD